MSQARGLREHPPDVQRRDGDDPKLHAADADNQLRQVARREVELLRPSDISCETHRTGHRQPRHENAARPRRLPERIRAPAGASPYTVFEARIWQSQEWRRYV